MQADVGPPPNNARSQRALQPRILELDGLRGVSIILVLAFHVGFIAGIDRGRYVPALPIGTKVATAGPPGLFESLVARGYVGVLIFFVLSGFLIAGPFIRWRICGEAPVPIGRYLARRLMRIEPPYIIAMVASFALMRLLFPISGWSLGASLAHVHQAAYGFASPWNAPAWSLEVEVQWYLTVPLIAFALSSRARARRYLIATVLIVAALCFQSSADLASTRTDTTLVSWLQFFLAGWLAADLVQTSAIGRWLRPRLWDVVGAVGWPALFVIIGRWSLQMTIAPILIAVLMVAALRGPTTGRVLRQGWLLATGWMSFSIYLVHFPIFLFLRRLIGPAPSSSFGAEFAFWAVVLVPVTLFVSAAFHRLIERPFAQERWRMWLVGSNREQSHHRTEDVTRSGTSIGTSPIAPPAAVP